MSFGFGNTFSTSANTSAFGSTAAKPTAFGAPIMSSTTSTAPTFGLGSTTASTPAPAFGSSGFGTSNSAFGAPSTGFGGFGTSQSSTGFGGFGGFGSSTVSTTTATTGFGGFGSFGATSTAPSTGFSFGATVSSAPTTGFSFGAPTTTTVTSGFGGFGVNVGTTFGQTSTTAGFGSFANSFGAKPTTGFGLGGSTFGAPQQQQQPPPVEPSAAFYDSILNCQVFGDERDDTLRRWNLLQALYGCGKGGSVVLSANMYLQTAVCQWFSATQISPYLLFNQQAPPVEYTMKNPFCRFKAIAYSERPTTENKDGRVALIFNKKEDEIRPLESQLLSNLVNILGNKPNLSPSVESIRAMSDTKTMVVISVQEKASNGSVRKVPAQELAAYLVQPMPKQQLTSLQVQDVFPQVELSPEQLREYLDTPPAGIDAQTWQQAQEDNPLPDRLIPVPVVGFSEVRWRIKCQELQASSQQAVLDNMAEEMADLQRKHTATVANIVEYKSRLVELQHRILKVVILQEKSRKAGTTLLPEEEGLSSRLEALSATFNSTAFKNRLSALTEGVKCLADSNKEPQRYKMDPSVISDIKQFLSMGQAGLSHTIETIQTDLSELKSMKDGMARLLQRPL